MSPGTWLGEAAASRSPQSINPAFNNDEQMARHLASRYSASQLSQLFRRVGALGSVHMTDDRSSLLSTSSYASSAMSEEPGSIFDSAASVKSFSDTSSIFSTASSKFGGRPTAYPVQTQFEPPEAHPGTHSSKENSPSALLSPGSARSVDSSSTPHATTPKQKSSFMCSFCKEVDITKTCTRKNDLKRHIEDFHHTNAQWVCRYRGCQMVFDWQTAYKAHLKTEHGGSRMSPDEAKVNLCPQVVFACGFENCSQVFEACDDTEALSMFKDYVTHVVKHFDDGEQRGEWTYTKRLKNLMLQSQINQTWMSSGLDSATRSRLHWEPQSSSVLRKRLECRHIKDPAILVQYAVSLGSDLNPPPDLPKGFVTPLRDNCNEMGPGHTTLKRPLQQQQQQQDSSDQFNFRISRGSNPGLAQFYNAQRRIYAPPRSPNARRHTHHSPRSSMSASSPPSNSTNGLGHYSLLNSRANSANYDASLPDSLPPPLYNHGGQSFHVGDGMMQHQPQDFMKSEDVPGLRASSPEDIGMADAAPHPTIPMPYSGIIHQPRAADLSPHMEQHSSFYHDEVRHSGPILNGEYMNGTS